MAEFLNQARPSDDLTADGMAAFGKPVPQARKSAALTHLRSMGVSDTNKATACIDRMAEQIKRDEPYKAMSIGMQYLDLTGTYRLLAVLCTDPVPEVERTVADLY